MDSDLPRGKRLSLIPRDTLGYFHLSSNGLEIIQITNISGQWYISSKYYVCIYLTLPLKQDVTQG